MRTSYAIIVSSILLSGCASTVEFSSIDEADRECQGVSGTLLLESGGSCRAQILGVGPDSVTFLVRSTDSTRRYSKKDILAFKDRVHVRGALDGLVVGGLLGVPAGIVINSTKRPQAGIAAVAILSLTVTVGILVGFFEGHEYTYNLHLSDSRNRDSLAIISSNHLQPSGDQIAP